MVEPDLDTLRHALKTARAKGFAEVSLEAGGMSFEAKIDLSSVRSLAPAPPSTNGIEPTAPSHGEVTSTLVGYYQESKTPLAVGQKIEKGDSVAIVTALGLANDVESTVSGEVIEVCVKPGQAVEYGQVLAKVMP